MTSDSLSKHALGQMGPRRDQSIDIAKGILIFLVLVGHAIQFIFPGGDDFWSNPIFKSIYMFHMPAFALISGGLFAKSSKRNQFRTMLVSKSLALIFPMLSWCSCYALYQVIKAPLLSGSMFTGWVIASLDHFFNLFWFLWGLFFCYFIVGAMAAIRRDSFILLSIVGVSTGFLYTDIWLLDEMLFLLFFFIAGYIGLGFLITEKFKHCPFISISICIASLAISYTQWSNESYIYNTSATQEAYQIGNFILRGIAGIAGSILIISASRILSQLRGLGFPDLLAILGKLSLLIYIIQTFVFILLIGLVNSDVNPQLKLILSILAPLVIPPFCIVFNRIIRQSKWLCLLLSGGR